MAFDAFLKIEGVDGESRAAKHKNEIDILSYSWGMSNSGVHAAGGGGGAGKAVPLDFTFTHAIDKASPVLMLACAKGRHFPSATFTVERAGGDQAQKYFVIKLTDVLVSSLDQQGNFSPDGGGGPPLEQVSLAFVKIDFAHYAQNPDGSPGEPDAEASFDFQRQR